MARSLCLVLCLFSSFSCLVSCSTLNCTAPDDMAFSPNPRRPELLFNNALRSCVLLLGASGLMPMVSAAATTTQNSAPATVPSQAQFIDQKAFNVLAYVPPPTEFNGTSGVCVRGII